MRRHLRGIDHAVILVRDLDRARDTYRRLGFTLTPRGFHSLGSQNHCIMFGKDYLELMALPRPHPAFRYFADFLSRGEGVGAVALATDDADAAHAELVAAGIDAEPPLALSRPVQDLGEARFSLVQLPPGRTPGFRAFACQHHTPGIIWRSEYQQHPVGAAELAGIAIAAPDASPYAAVFGELPKLTAEGERIETGSAPLLVSDAARLGRKLEGVALPALAPPVVAALFIRVRDRERAAATLRRGGFAPARLPDGSYAIGADRAHGVALNFG